MRPEPAADLDVHSSDRSVSGGGDPLRRTSASSSAEQTARHAISEDELTVLQQAFDRYDGIECIQRGGQGVVYRARQKSTSRIVALKVLLDGPLATDRQRFRFEREIELVSRLRHPNIVTLYDSGVVRGRLFYAMEYVEGLPIDDYVVLQDLSPRSIVRLMVAVCRAIHFAHQNGVIHRDLKPVHIVLDDDGQPRVFDFGLAKDVLDDAADPRFSHTGLVMGTLPFMSPEQAGGGDGKADVRSDVYALGLILYRLLTEESPYPVDGPAEQTRRAIIGTEPLPLRKAVALSTTGRAPGLHEINRDLESVLGRALAKRKEERYQSAAELADDLERYLAGAAVTARAASRWYVLRKAIRKHRVAFGIAAAFGLLLMGSTVAVSLAWAETRTQRDVAVGRAETAFDFWEVAVDKVETQVQALPGGYKVRNELIKDLYDIASRLDTLDRSNPRLALVGMKLLEKKAAITLKQGQRDAARAFYRDLLTQAESAVLTTPGSDVHRLRIAAACGLALSSDQPAPRFERALAFGRQALDSCIGDDNVRYEFCETLVEFGSYLKRCREEGRALEIVDRALGLLPEIAFAPAENGAWPRLRARALGDRGAVLLKLGRGDEGLRELETALDIRERVAGACRADTIAKDDLMCACYRMAVAERDRGMIDDAIAHFERGAEVGVKLAEMDPTATTWNRNRFWLHYDFALLQMERGEFVRARESCAVAVQLAERAAAANARAFESRGDLALVANLQGRLELSAGDHDCALEQFERARELCDGLAQEFPAVPQYKQQLAETHHSLGVANRKLSRLDAARPNYELALRMYGELAESKGDAEDEINHVLGYLNLAALLLNYKQADHDRQARALLASASDQLEELKSRDRLVGYERRSEQIEAALRDNRAILDRREFPGLSQSRVD